MGDTTLADVEQALVEASNKLVEVRAARYHVRYKLLDETIDDAIRLVQAWKDEERGGTI